MVSAPFDYLVAESYDHAVGLLGEHAEDAEDAKILAGGQSLVPMLNLRLARPSVLEGEPIGVCLMLAVQADGHEITTAHGLCGEGDSLHPLQQCFLRRGASQCGFCTAGMLLTSYDLVNRAGSPTREEIRYALVGNLCRCTSYTKILDAVEEYAAEVGGGSTRSES